MSICTVRVGGGITLAHGMPKIGKNVNLGLRVGNKSTTMWSVSLSIYNFTIPTMILAHNMLSHKSFIEVETNTLQLSRLIDDPQSA